MNLAPIDALTPFSVLSCLIVFYSVEQFILARKCLLGQCELIFKSCFTFESMQNWSKTFQSWDFTSSIILNWAIWAILYGLYNPCVIHRGIIRTNAPWLSAFRSAPTLKPIIWPESRYNRVELVSPNQCLGL